MAGELIVARGARAAERIVLDAVAHWTQQVREDPQRLARPLRIVVPSRSLREHLAAAVVREARASVVGVAVHTLRGLAFELLRRAGGKLALAEALFPALVRRAAREEPVLARRLDELEDGYGAAVASVSDLLDAGLEPGHGEPLAEALAELGALGARARGIVQVALRSRAALEQLGFAHRGALFVRAREALEGAGGAALPPTRELWIHGYADATGLQADLLAALVLQADARFVLDEPPDPADPSRSDAGVRFTQRLAERIEGVAVRREAAAAASAGQLQLFASNPAPAEPPAFERFRAPGAHAEAREVAARVRAQLDAGARPEGIAIVARALEPYAIPLRTQLRRLGIPFSGGPGASGPLLRAGRELRALLDLLRHGEVAHTDRWLDAWRGPSRGQRARLRVAFHAVGAPRLRDVVRLDLDALLGTEQSFALPVRRGFAAEGEAGDPAAEPDRSEPTGRALRARRVHLGRDRLAEAIARAGELVQRLEAFARSTTLEQGLAAIQALGSESLGWRARAGDERSAAAQLERALASLRGDLAHSLALASGELLAVLEAALRGAGRDALGGEGAGVAVLSVTEARARTFEHLFVMGLNRDLFPRTPSDDPLLGEPARRAIEPLLPDVPLKARAQDEERYLFAQLLSASPDVTLSFQAVTDDGKERTPSPLVERLRLAKGGAEAPLAPSHVLAAGGGPHTGFEHAVRAALGGSRASLERALALAFDAAPGGERAPVPVVGGKDLARARVALLRELERAPRGALGPFFGSIGARAEADPREARPSVTALERLATCGWQAFLERVLRLEPAPDSRSTLPALGPLLLGNLVHRALEQIAVDAGVPSGVPLSELREAAGREVPWPAPDALSALLRRLAPQVAHEAGIRFPGFARLLAVRARAALERVAEVDFAGGCARGVLGAEVEGEVEVHHGAAKRGVAFRSDRVDRLEAGLRLTDYKTGKPLSEAAGAATRARKLRQGVESGRALQAAAYAFGAGGRGRYLYMRPHLEAERLELAVDAGDEDLRAAFETSVGVLLDAWDAGAFPPRLLEPKGTTPSACQYCAVAEACVQGDSGARARLRQWLDASPRGEGDPAEAAGRALFRLGRSA